MLKRLLTLITVLLMITVFSVAQAQETASGEPVLVLTEEQINAQFRLPSTATRIFSDVEVDVKSDGVYISFDLTTTRNGTTTTNPITAIVIGFLHGDFSTFGTNLHSSPLPITDDEQRQISNEIAHAWRNWMYNATEGDERGLDVVITDENGQYFYAAGPSTPG